MPMKPPEFYAFDLAEFLIGEKALPLFERAYAGIFRSPRGAGPAANLRRILTFTLGRTPSSQELDSALGQMGVLYARYQFACNRLPANSRDFIERVQVRAFPQVAQLLKMGNGAILAGCHTEPAITLLGAAALAHHHEVPVTALADFAEPYEAASRAIPNLRYLPMLASAAPCLSALRRNEVVFFLGDIDYFPGGRTADFFGAPFHPPQGAAKLALAAQAPILPVYGLSQENGFVLGGEEVIGVNAESGQEELESSLLRAFERIIGRHPAHWLVLRDAWDLEAGLAASRLLLRRISLRNRIKRFFS